MEIINNAMLRSMNLKIYGISQARYCELRNYCRIGKYMPEMRVAALIVEEITGIHISEYILYSVQKNCSFDKLEYHKILGRITCGRTDFYSYRRLFYHLFDMMIRAWDEM